jgi:translation elongation factor P/translation initiation factor 5A
LTGDTGDWVFTSTEQVSMVDFEKVDDRMTAINHGKIIFMKQSKSQPANIQKNT